MVLRYLGQSENREIQERMKDIELDIEEAEEKKNKANMVLLFISSLDQESTYFIYNLYIHALYIHILSRFCLPFKFFLSL